MRCRIRQYRVQLVGSRIATLRMSMGPIDLQGKVVQFSSNILTKEHSKLYRCFRVAEVP